MLKAYLNGYLTKELYMKQPTASKMAPDEFVDLSNPSTDSKKQGTYGIMISTAQCWTSDIRACEVIIVPTFCETEKISQLLSYG